MVINNIYKFENPIEIKPGDFNKLESMILKYHPCIKYKASLKNGSTIVFESLEELEGFSNEPGKKILELVVVAGSQSYTNEIEIYFKETPHFIKAFAYTIKVECKFYDKDKETLFYQDIKSFFSHLQLNRFLTVCSKISSRILTLVLSCLLTCLGVNQIINSNTTTDLIYGLTPITFISLIVMAILIVCLGFDKFWCYMFPPIVFLLGEEIKRDNWRKQVRTTVFIVACLGIVVSLIASFIFSLIGN